jgi:hypothetical protein
VQIIRQINKNLDATDARWRKEGGSQQNWRWEQMLDFKPRLTVDEKTVEKLVASHGGEDWINQVPTAFGLMNGRGERHCNIDLVHRTGDFCYEFIELKLEDSGPLFAAFELVKYALLFLVSRERRDDFEYSIERNPLLWANSISLVVLAPPEFYEPMSFKRLGAELNDAFALLSTAELSLKFEFQQMAWPHDGDYKTAIMSLTCPR